MRSAVFFPTPGIFTSRARSPARRAFTRSLAARPLRTVTASFGPMPLTPISFSKSCFSVAEAKPNRAIASSRTCVKIRSFTSAPKSGSLENVVTGMVTS